MFDNLKNTIDFFIRNTTRFSRKNYIEKNPEIIKRTKKENSYVNTILEKYFDKKPNEFVKVLDVGSKNWSYVQGEYDFFNSFCSDFELTGVEIDAYRLYGNFYSRFEYAKFYIKELKNTHYVANNVLNIKDEFDYIIWFLPFITKKPHLAWGLPEKFFLPKITLEHVYNLLNKNGQLLILNQGENEMKIQKGLLEELQIEFLYLGEIEDKFNCFKNKRYGFLIKK